MGTEHSKRAIKRAKYPTRRTIKRSFPLVGLLLYYGALVLVASGLIAFVPGFREALIAPISEVAGGAGGLSSARAAVVASTSPWTGIAGRGALTLTAIAWALVVTLPVAWTLTRTRRLRYDPSLVHTLIVLPLVVAGVVLVVKNSLALAFSLAGIVAGVRFRQTLEEPEEAVYVLLSLGIGLAAGVQALDIALVMSMAFTLIVMTLWRYDIGSIYSRGRGAQLAIGDKNLLKPSVLEEARDIAEREAAQPHGLKSHGMLVVSTYDREGARHAVENVLGRLATEWRIVEPTTSNGVAQFDALLCLKKNADPADLVAELEARWSEEIAAAEYVPLGMGGGDS
ncbi:MAG TPA: DUF4956 domain-containing protein [Gemmatimonadaceae bacterium]